jgi:hypothetical protein
MTSDAQQPQREHPIDGADLKAIENFIYSTMNHTKEWELAENAYQRILTARSRPHTPAPEHKPLVGFEFNPACDCSVCQDEKAAWEQRAARTATLATLDKIIAYRKAQSKVFGVQTAWEGEGAYILELSKEQERP